MVNPPNTSNAAKPIFVFMFNPAAVLARFSVSLCPQAVAVESTFFASIPAEQRQRVIDGPAVAEAIADAALTESYLVGAHPTTLSRPSARYPRCCRNARQGPGPG